ncbi:MAG: hypothetical protein HOY76_01705 [Streptomyces sp.]|nr:hypothetical protein [Streptomyces sp.]
MTPARTTPQATEVNLFDLPLPIRDKFLDYMDQADTTISVTEIRLAHTAAAQLIGMQLPPRGEIAVCSCPCFCQIIFDVDQAHEYNDGYGPTFQCPGCADDHPGRDAE